MAKLKELLVYAKITILGLLALAVGLVFFKNRLYTTKFWPFASEVEVATLWLILATSVGSIVVFWVCTKLRRVFSELRELRLQRDQRRLLDEQRRRQEELNAQEKRIDEKLRNAAGPQGSERGG